MAKSKRHIQSFDKEKTMVPAKSKRKTSFDQFDKETRKRMGLDGKPSSDKSASKKSSGGKSSKRSPEPVTRSGAGGAERSRAAVLSRKYKNEQAGKAAEKALKRKRGK